MILLSLRAYIESYNSWCTYVCICMSFCYHTNSSMYIYLVKITVTVVNFTLQVQYEIGTKLQKWHWTTYLVGLYYM